MAMADAVGESAGWNCGRLEKLHAKILVVVQVSPHIELPANLANQGPEIFQVCLGQGPKANSARCGTSEAASVKTRTLPLRLRQLRDSINQSKWRQLHRELRSKRRSGPRGRVSD